MLILAVIFSTGCPPKIVRVAITENDKVKAEDAAHQGDLAFSHKDYYAALIKYLESVKLNPNSDTVFNRLGITYSILKYYDAATTAFTNALALNPKFPFAVNNLGSVYFAQRNLRKAEKCFKKAISMKENEASFHINLGSLYLEKKKYDKAMIEWRRGFALDPDVFSKTSSVSLTGGGSEKSPMERYFLLARLFASQGNVDAALDNLKQALTHGFTDIQAIEKQPDFKPIRQDPRFVEFMENAPLLIKLKANVGLPENTPPPSPRVK